MGQGTSGSKLYDAMAVEWEWNALRRTQANADKPGRRRVLMILIRTHRCRKRSKGGEGLRAAQLANVTILKRGAFHHARRMQAKPQDTRPQITQPARTDAPLPGRCNADQRENRYGIVI